MSLCSAARMNLASTKRPYADTPIRRYILSGSHSHSHSFTVRIMQLAIENLNVIGNELAIRWNNGSETYIPLELLRHRCPCALCAGEKDLLGNVHGGGQEKLTPASFELKRCDLVGGYGIQPHWMDGHSSGIFSFSYLLAIDSATE